MTSQRLFYALWPDQAVSRSLAQWQASLHGRMTHPDDFHVTLVFLGNRSPDLLPVFQEILMGLPAADMTLHVDLLGYFRRNRIAWAGMKAPPPALFRLQEQLACELRRRSIPFQDSAEFKPHITLARSADAPGERAFAPITWQADRIALVRSLAGSHGAKYQVVASRRR